MKEETRKLIESLEDNGIPIFILSANNQLAIDTLNHYKIMCNRERCPLSYIEEMKTIIKQFAEWQNLNEEKILYPR